MAQNQRVHAADDFVAARPEEFAPRAFAQQCSQFGIRATQQQARFVEQRRRITRAVPCVGRPCTGRSHVHGVERGLGARKQKPRERIERVVQVAFAGRDLAAAGNGALIVERAQLLASRDERKRPAVGQRQRVFARESVECRKPRAAPGVQPAGVRRETGVNAVPRRRSAQCLPPSDMTMMTPMRIASTRNAIFHGLFGYSPWIAPVTPFCTHWKLLAPNV